MTYGNVFERYELKYLLNARQYAVIRQGIDKYMRADKYGHSDICNIYCDTPDWLLVRRSIEKPVYKEKLRIRSYGVAKESSDVFMEIKKKYQSVVYKRRICVAEKSACAILGGSENYDSQIGREIAYFLKSYRGIGPKMYLSYSREAFYAADDGSFRITFDRNILWRDYDLSLRKGIYGYPILPAGTVLMEVKTAFACPMWLTSLLSGNSVYKTSFSKYGTAYMQMKESLYGGKKIA